MQFDLFMAASGVVPGKWPSEQLNDLLTGKIKWDEAQPAIRSWASFYIYDAAKQLVTMPDKEKRRMALGKIPSAIRPFVEKEVKRIWPMRASL